jgi:alpha-1,3-rhamnosyl/mannosyltransferase
MRSLEHAAMIVAVSEITARAVRSLAWIDPDRVVVVPEGVHPRFARPANASAVAIACRAHRVEPGAYDLFIGQQTARKDLRVVVEALALADDPHPLVIAGPPGDATDALQAQAARLGVGHLLRWPGFVPDEELHLLLHGARALLHPCGIEGFGLTPLEAMAAGTPAVVAGGGAVVETVGDAALVCPAHDPPSWAEAIDSLRDGARRADLASRGRARAAELTWPAVAERTRAVYAGVLARRGPAA